MKGRHRAVCLTMVWALALGCPLARADGDAPAPSLAESLRGPAKVAYDSATLLFKNGDFAGATVQYRSAYELSKDPRLLYDMAICERNRHAYARMRELLERYEREAGPALSTEQRAVVDDALAASRKLVGTITVTANVADATVNVDGETTATPLGQPIVVDQGRHTLVVRQTGFEAATQSADVAGGANASVAVVLRPDVHVGRLMVSAPAGSSVWIDGELAGTDRYDGELPSGPHALRVVPPGGAPYETHIELHDRETRSVQVGATTAPVAWPWVVGGVAVAAGLAVGAYVLFKPQEQTSSVPTGSLAGVHFNVWRGR